MSKFKSTLHDLQGIHGRKAGKLEFLFFEPQHDINSQVQNKDDHWKINQTALMLPAIYQPLFVIICFVFQQG